MKLLLDTASVISATDFFFHNKAAKCPTDIADTDLRAAIILMVLD